MKKLALLMVSSLFSGLGSAVEYSGHVAAELQVFPEAGQFQNQLDENLSLSFQPKLRHAWNNGDDELTVELFMRADERDDARQHGDIRELKWLHIDGPNEWRVGIDTVFWGVTESRHLVDVINQIDGVEGIDGEDKLGQPMIHFTTLRDWGVFHVFVLAGFREATFHSDEGRLRFPLSVDTGQTQYQSSDTDSHVDFALRYTHSIGDTELGLSVFDGTSRDALLLPGLNSNGLPVLVPYYEQMTQYGVDVQSIVENWLWKLEVIHREIDSGSFNAMTAGFEYTFYALAESAIDLGTLLEYSYEDRERNAGVFDNDLFAGLRFAFNDVQSTEILAGLIVDTDNQGKTVRVEMNRRLGDSWKITGELQVFTSIDQNDPLKAFEKDDFVLIELARYF